MVSSVGSSLLPLWAAAFHQAYPDIRFELFEANTYQLLEQLRSNLLELAIVRTPFHAEGFVCTSLCEEPMLAVGSETFFPENTSISVVHNKNAYLSTIARMFLKHLITEMH